MGSEMCIRDRFNTEVISGEGGSEDVQILCRLGGVISDACINTKSDDVAKFLKPGMAGIGIQ